MLEAFCLGFLPKGRLLRCRLEMLTAAVDAWLRYGKGRHTASLNFGDCLSYATAALAGEPLLCVGNDFAQTDLALA
jgi:uncharacterized protein with PIN domain